MGGVHSAYLTFGNDLSNCLVNETLLTLGLWSEVSPWCRCLERRSQLANLCPDEGCF